MRMSEKCRNNNNNNNHNNNNNSDNPLTSAKRYCQTCFGEPVLSITDFSLIDKPFSLKKHPFGFVNKRKITY